MTRSRKRQCLFAGRTMSKSITMLLSAIVGLIVLVLGYVQFFLVLRPILRSGLEKENATSFYYDNSGGFNWLDEIKINQSVFLIETNANRTELSPLIYCAVESTAWHNPDRDIYMLLPHDIKMDGIPGYFAYFPRVQFRAVDYAALVKGSIVEKIWPKAQKCKFNLENMSDILRAFLLFKYGGYYLDTDFISLKKLPVGKSFLVMQDGRFINSAIMHFTQGHHFLEVALDDLTTNFQGYHWGYQGPQLMTRTCRKVCQPPLKRSNIPGPCTEDMDILESRVAYPVPYGGYSRLYEPARTQQILGVVKNSLAIHVWNFMCKKACNSEMKPGTPIHTIAARNCPFTIESFNSQ